MKHISFVVPVFNEEANLREFYQRLTDIMSALPYEYDLTFVDDGSKDSSAVILAELVRNDERVQAYLLSRNYGHQLALTCGLDYADEIDAIMNQFSKNEGKNPWEYNKMLQRFLLHEA